MDQAGILVNGGFQCCDAWEVGGSLTTAQQNDPAELGADHRHEPAQPPERVQLPVVRQPAEQPAGIGLDRRVHRGRLLPADPADRLGRVQEHHARSAPSGEKEGPYDWVPPDYWYDTTHLGTDSTVTNAGASWGYDSEESAGNTIPTMDSLNRFMSASDLANLWQNTKAQPVPRQLRATAASPATRSARCATSTPRCPAGTAQWTSLAQYVEEAQAQDYENTRAQFEAFIDHANNTPLPSTGTIYWQMNKGWPSLLWNLYNNDGDQAGSYFGAQEANRSLHAHLRPRHRHGHAGQPRQHHPDRPVGRSRRCTTWPGPCSTTRPPATSA